MHRDEKIIVGTVSALLTGLLVALAFLIRKDIKNCERYMEECNCGCNCNCKIDYWKEEE